MACMADVEVREGLRELQQRLDELRIEQAAKVLRRGLRANASVIQAEFVECAPVWPALPSGTALPEGALKFDMQIRSIYRGVPKGGVVVTVGPGKSTAHVARSVEFGHRLVAGGRLGKRGKGKQVIVWPPIPSCGQPLKRQKTAALRAFQDSVKTDLDKLQTPGGK